MCEGGGGKIISLDSGFGHAGMTTPLHPPLHPLPKLLAMRAAEHLRVDRREWIKPQMRSTFPFLLSEYYVGRGDC